MIKKKRVLITGVAGSIGSELARQLKKDYIIYGIDTNETGLFDLIGETGIVGRVGDIREEFTVRDVFSDFKPGIVYHAAAYKHVTPMEWTPLEAIKTNIIGTYNLIHYARVYEAKKFIFISTDKAVQSSSIMGATKRLGEIMCKNQGKGFMVVRFGNVLGSRGSVIPIWQRQMDKGQALTVTDREATRYMMTIEEACELVIKAANEGQGGEIYVLDMGKPVNVLSLAKQIVKEFRNDVPIEMIGLRPGEALHEKLMFNEEEKIAIKKDKYWVIQ